MSQNVSFSYYLFVNRGISSLSAMRTILSRKSLVFVLAVLTIPFLLSRFTGVHQPLGVLRDAFDDWPNNMSIYRYPWKPQSNPDQNMAFDDEASWEGSSWWKPLKQTAKGTTSRWQEYKMPETELLVHAPGETACFVTLSLIWCL